MLKIYSKLGMLGIMNFLILEILCVCANIIRLRGYAILYQDVKLAMEEMIQNEFLFDGKFVYKNKEYVQIKSDLFIVLTNLSAGILRLL